MALYCGIDLHSTNHVVVVIDEQDRRVVEKRLPNDLQATLRLLGPYAEELQGIAIESTFNWYRRVDGLMANGYAVSLVDSRHLSDGKKKGAGNAKAGNKYLSWVFSEAAHFAVRFEPRAQRFYERKRAQRNGMVAIRAAPSILWGATGRQGPSQRR